MCIFCVLQEVSGRAKAMLPWLVIALAGLWAFSQFLPPPFRIDMTSARLACFLFLVLVVFWQRVLRPQLCSWQARRSARIRERRWTEAVELQKLRKIAVRRCRNCLTPYREQNPGGGKFMCAYCGHVSKRPVLDISGTRSSSGIVSDLVGKHGWNCQQDWSREGNGNWVGGGAPRYLLGGGGGDDRCLSGKWYSGAAVLSCRSLYKLFLSMRWLFRKVFGGGSSSDNVSLDADNEGLSKKGEGGGNYQESKGEKARRKAEEKRQARLEKEMLEEEERKQREEVARLIEERRKLRDEMLEAEREQSRSSHPEKGRDSRKESEKKRQERRKDKDKNSSKSNSDGEDLEKRTGRESEKKREFDKKSENEKRDFQKACIENIRTQISEATLSSKTNANKPRYFDRMAGSFLSSSRGFSGANFFGKGVQSSVVPVSKPTKPMIMPVDRREIYSSGHIIGAQTSNVEDKNSHQQSVTCNTPPANNVWKKSWQQLFTYSSVVSPSLDSKGISNVTQNVQQPTEVKDHQASASFPLLNQIHFEQSSPFAEDTLISDSHGSKKNPFNPLVGEKVCDSISEEGELFEDLCYVPDPVTLLGPVSESLDSFPADFGNRLIANVKVESPSVLRNTSTSAAVSKPSPIAPPMSRSQMSKERPAPIGQLTGSPRSRDTQSLVHGGTIQTNEQGTWQMWDTPLGLDQLGIVASSANRPLPLGNNKLNLEDTVHPLAQNTITSFVTNDSHLFSSSSGQNTYVGIYQKEDLFTPLGSCYSEDNPWLRKKVFQELPGDAEKKLPVNLGEDITMNEVSHDNPNRSVPGHYFEQCDSWTNADWATSHSEDVKSATLPTPQIGGLFPTTDPDVQSVWSFK